MSTTESQTEMTDEQIDSQLAAIQTRINKLELVVEELHDPERARDHLQDLMHALKTTDGVLVEMTAAVDVTVEDKQPVVQLTDCHVQAADTDDDLPTDPDLCVVVGSEIESASYRKLARTVRHQIKDELGELRMIQTEFQRMRDS